jgi:hypothetical protein
VNFNQIIFIAYLIVEFCSRAVGLVHDTAVRLVISPFSGWCRRQFGDAGAAVPEEVAADIGVRGAPGERWPIQRVPQRYGPPPGSAPVARGPALPAERVTKPSTSALVNRMVSRPNVDSQAAQLAVAELQLAIRNAQVSSLFLYEYSNLYVLRCLAKIPVRQILSHLV